MVTQLSSFMKLNFTLKPTAFASNRNHVRRLQLQAKFTPVIRTAKISNLGHPEMIYIAATLTCLPTNNVVSTDMLLTKALYAFLLQISGTLFEPIFQHKNEQGCI